MTRIYRTIGLLVWLVCSLAAAGFLNASLDDGFRWSTKAKCESIAHREQSAAIVIGLFGGPVSLIVSLAFSGFGYTGWSILPHSCEGHPRE